MKKFICFLMFIAVCSACEIKAPLIKTWKITKIEMAEADTLSEELYQDVYLSFYDDGSLSYYQEYGNDMERHALYRVGRWKEFGAGIETSLERFDFKRKLNVLEVNADWLVLEFTDGEPASIGTQLKCQATVHYKTNSTDLFHPKNNAWRIKPAKKETPEEIEARVVNHVQYLIDYFELVEKKEQGYFETTHLQTPFRFYSNGLSLPADFTFHNDWVTCFYDEADAAAGGKLLSKSMDSMEEFPSNKKSYTKGYHDAMVMMKEYLVK